MPHAKTMTPRKLERLNNESYLRFDNASRRVTELARRGSSLCQQCGLQPKADPWLICQTCIESNRSYRQELAARRLRRPQEPSAPVKAIVRRPVSLPFTGEAVVVWDGTSRELLSGMRTQRSSK